MSARRVEGGESRTVEIPPDVLEAMRAPRLTPLEAIRACSQPDQPPSGARGHATLNLSGRYRCPMALPPPDPAASSRVPSAADPGLVDRVTGSFATPERGPLADEKRRLFASFGGLDNLIRVFAPNELDGYRRLLARTRDTSDPAALRANEVTLRAAKDRFVGEVRRVLVEERRRAHAAGTRFDRLEVLRSRGLVWPGWTLPQPGRAAIAEVPEDDWRDARGGLHSQRVPLEAELILGSSIPIGIGSERGIVFIRGEDFGLQDPIASATAEATRRAGEALVTAAGRAERATLTTELERRVAEAAARADGFRGAFRDGARVIAETEEALAVARRNAEEAQRRATTAATTERAPVAQLEAELQLLSGTNLVINFTPGRADILPSSRPALDELVRELQSPNIADLAATVEGHTDARGSAIANQTLSERRATAVRDYLIAAGVLRTRLTALGMGARQPLDPASPLADRNRRVRVSVDIPPERENQLHAKLAEAQEAYAASLEAHQRVATEAAEAMERAAAAHQAAIVGRQQSRLGAVEALTARVDASNAARRAARASAIAVAADERAQATRREAEAYLARARSRGEGFFTISYVDSDNVLNREPPHDLAPRVAQALTSEPARARFGELFSQCRGADCRRLATVVGEIVAEQETQKPTSRVMGDRLRTIWSQFLGEQARPRGRFVNVSGTFGPHSLEPSPYRVASIPLPELARPTELVIPIDVVVEEPRPARVEPPREPETDAELALENAPATGDTGEPPPAQPAAPPQPQPLSASPTSEAAEIQDGEGSALWTPNLPAMRVGNERTPNRRRSDELAVEIVVVGNPTPVREPVDEVVVIDPELSQDAAPSATPDAAAIAAAAEAARQRSAEAAARAAAAVADARAARDRAGQGAAIPSDVARRGRSTSVRLDINFARDSHVIENTAPIDALVPTLLSTEFRGRRILIAGHTDKTGSDDHNQRLSLRRAQAVREQLVRRGVPNEVLVIEGFGAQRPIPGTDPTDAANRRVVISVMELQQ